jgi:hypothetical protein
VDAELNTLESQHRNAEDLRAQMEAESEASEQQEELAEAANHDELESPGLEGNLRPGHEIRERSTGARIILTNYVSTLDAWRFRMAPGSHHGDLTRDPLITNELLRQSFERVTD